MILFHIVYLQISTSINKQYLIFKDGILPDKHVYFYTNYKNQYFIGKNFSL